MGDPREAFAARRELMGYTQETLNALADKRGSRRSIASPVNGMSVEHFVVDKAR